MNYEVGTSTLGTASSVEQRWSQRRPVSVPVEVFEHGNHIANCVSRDICLGGVFLALKQEGVKKEREVDLFFTLGSESPTKYKLKAKVVRINNEGTGFMFKDFDTNAFRALQEIMRFSSKAN